MRVASAGGTDAGGVRVGVAEGVAVDVDVPVTLAVTEAVRVAEGEAVTVGGAIVAVHVGAGAAVAGLVGEADAAGATDGVAGVAWQAVSIPRTAARTRRREGITQIVRDERGELG